MNVSQTYIKGGRDDEWIKADRQTGMRKVNREAEEEGGGGERNAAGIGWQTRRQINDRKKK